MTKPIVRDPIYRRRRWNRFEACADDLASASDVVKKKIAEGATTVAAHAALASTEQVESKVRESADDLHEVNDSLARGLDDLKRTETALTESRTASADTEATLATARQRALHDSATNLPNRDLFDDRLTHAIAGRAARLDVRGDVPGPRWL